MSGEIVVDTHLGRRSKDEMIMTAKARKILADRGDLEAVDLSQFGVAANWFPKDQFHWLEICTRNQILRINTRHIQHQIGGTDDAEKKRVAIVLPANDV